MTRKMDDAELLRRLREEVEAGFVRESREGDLAVFKYSQQCVIQGRWNTATMAARGLVFDLSTGKRLTAPSPSSSTWRSVRTRGSVTCPADRSPSRKSWTAPAALATGTLASGDSRLRAA